jgi:drug/metabolite transporter (DMT)-like permease
MKKSDVLKVILVTLLWALCFPLIKVGLSSGAPPLLFGAFRTAIAALALAGLAIGHREKLSVAAGHKKWLFALGLMAFLAYFGMVLGGSSLNPGLASVVANSNPIMASLLAAAFLSEKLSWARAAGLLFGFIGVILISIPTFSGNSSNNLTGIGLVLVGALGTAAGNVLLKKMAKSNVPISVLAIQFSICSTLLFLASIFNGDMIPQKIDYRLLGSLIVLALGGTALADVAWIDLLKTNSLTKLNVFIFLTPAFSLAMGTIFFGEKFGSWEVGGIGAILTGILLSMKKTSSKTHNGESFSKTTRESTIQNAGGVQLQP